MKQIRTQFKIPVKTMCLAVDMNYHTIMKWKRLSPDCHPRRSLKKLTEHILQDIRNGLLPVKNKRTKDPQSLYQQKYKDSCTANQFNLAKKAAVKEHQKDRKKSLAKVKWKEPNIAWAMDDTEHIKTAEGKRLFIHNIKDVASGYILEPLAGDFAKGKDVADNLNKLIKQHGAPLILKRDNGSNLNCKEVDELLHENYIIDLNSPPYYSRYNGSIENSNRYLKEAVGIETECDKETYKLKVQLAAHELNHKRKRSLGYKIPCQVFHSRKKNYPFNKTQRRILYEDLIKETYEQIQELMFQNLNQYKKTWKRLWRKNVEEFLINMGYIEVINNEVSTN